MAEVTSGARAVLSQAWIYQLMQTLVGANRMRRILVQQYIHPSPSMRVLDIGCGPADLLDFLGPVEYMGFDHNDGYIQSARKRFGNSGRFHCQSFDENTILETGLFDCVLAIGLLHHLDDEPCRNFFGVARAALRPGGQLLTIDPCYSPEQSFLARWIISRDRGRNVRTQAGYLALAAPAFPEVRAAVRHDMTHIPYTHIILSCPASSTPPDK